MHKRTYPEGTMAVTVKEAAAMLGISEYTLMRHVKSGVIRSFTIGKLIRIPRAAITELLEGDNERTGSG